MDLDRTGRVVEGGDRAGDGRAGPSVVVGHQHLAVDDRHQAGDDRLVRAGGGRIDEGGVGEPGLHRRAETAHELDESRRAVVHGPHRLEVESGSVGLPGGHEGESLGDEPVLRRRAPEEGAHLRRPACGIEELERGDHPDTTVVRGIGDRGRTLTDIFLVADPVRVDRAGPLDA
jgi:hypothetical protein